MANDARDHDDGGSKPAPEGDLSARLRQLGDRLQDVEAARPSSVTRLSRPSSDGSGLARGMRLSAEMVGGVLVGVGIGWLFDRALGTSPWGFIVFFLLGFAGGVLNVVRSVGAYPGGSDRR